LSPDPGFEESVLPKISRIFIKTGLIYFVISLMAGILSVGEPLGISNTLTNSLFIPFLHIFMVGWVTHIIIGVASWFFPRYSKEQPKGPIWLLYVSFVALNIGLVLRIPVEVFIAMGRSGPLWRWGLVVSAAGQWVGAVAFVGNIWYRIG
jgi:hypothetical protein